MCFSVKKTGKCHSFTFVCAEVDVPLLEWEYLPPIGPRPLKGFVGLKNAGATCYMNSLLQQLFMIDEIRSSILQVEGAAHDNMDDYDDEKLEVEVSVTSLIGHFVTFAPACSYCKRLATCKSDNCNGCIGINIIRDWLICCVDVCALFAECVMFCTVIIFVSTLRVHWT